MNTVSLHLAAVERHLRHDEESSVDTGASFRLESSAENSPVKQGRRKRLDSNEGRCSTPPRLERRHRSSQRLRGDPRGALHTLGSRMMGMSVVTNTKTTAEQRTIDDTLSLSSDSSLDSDRALERKAQEIREDLRVAQLIEIAAVAERAAAAGHDSFTGLASTFGQGLRPVQMKRNHTYTEGSQAAAIPSTPTPLRRTQTTDRRRRRRKRKIPVMALRHIDDLIPPMNQLHLHLRSHLYRSGVQTENSLVEEPVVLELMEKKGYEASNTGSSTSDVSFIEKMKLWVSNSATVGEEEKKIGATEVGDDKPSFTNDFVLGDRLCEQITGVEVTSGAWRPSPVEIPVGLIPPDEQDFMREFTSPNRRRLCSVDVDQKTIETEPTTSNSSENGESANSQSNQPPPMTPVALFDDDGGDAKLGSRTHPKPFHVLLNTQNAPELPLQLGKRRNSTNSPGTAPNLFITPVRLKGMRDMRSKRVHSRCQLAWGYSRADSFRSDSGMSPLSSEMRRGSFASCDEELTKSETSIFVGLSDGYNGVAKSFLRPRSMSVSQMINSIGTIETFQAAGESTQNPCDPSTLQQDIKPSTPPRAATKPPSEESALDDSLDFSDAASVLPITDAIASKWMSSESLTMENLNLTPESVTPENSTPALNPNPVFATPKGTPERLRKKHQFEPLDASQTDSVLTPAPPNCQCLALTNAAIMGMMDSESNLQPQESRKLALASKSNNLDDSATPLVGFRRTNSCPSLVDTFNVPSFGKLSPTLLKSETKKSILQVFQRLSPKSTKQGERNLYFTPGDNHEYLNNYLYCGKPSQQKEEQKIEEIEKIDEVRLQPFSCGGTDAPCAGAVAEGCDFINAVSETATALFKSDQAAKERDYALIFETPSSSDFSAFAEVPETWFAAASERFDGALERLVGSTEKSNTEWKANFEAPTLNIKTPQSARKARRNSAPLEYDPRNVEGIILVSQGDSLFPVEDGAQTPRSPSQDNDAGFSSMYGITRNEYRSLNKDERLVLWQRHQDRMNISLPTLGLPTQFPTDDNSFAALTPDRKPKGHRRHRSALSG